jgi:hypothetical protein
MVWRGFWIIPIMLAWVVALGAVAYAAVTLATRNSHQH